MTFAPVCVWSSVVLLMLAASYGRPTGPTPGTSEQVRFQAVTCRMTRRASGLVAIGLWSTALGVALRSAREQGHPVALLLLLVGAAAAATVIGGVGFMLSKGSAEAVFQMGIREGRRLQLEECAGKAVANGGGVVLALPVRR